MSKDDQTGDDAPESDSLNKLLLRLQLPFMRAHYHELAQTAVEQGWGPLDYLQRLGVDVIWMSPVYRSPSCSSPRTSPPTWSASACPSTATGRMRRWC